jgi:hypothetical protein
MLVFSYKLIKQCIRRKKVFILGGFIMARLIQFYVPQSFKPPKRQWVPLKQRGKIIPFRSGVMKKSA